MPIAPNATTTAPEQPTAPAPASLPNVDKTVGQFEALKTAKLPVRTGNEAEFVASRVTIPDTEKGPFQANLRFTPNPDNVQETAEQLMKLRTAIQYDTALKWNAGVGDTRYAATVDINNTLIEYTTKADPKNPQDVAQILDKATSQLTPEKKAELEKRLEIDPTTKTSKLSEELFNRIARSYEISVDRKADDPKGIREILTEVSQNWPQSKINELKSALHMDPATGKSDLSTDLFYRYERKINGICKNFCDQTPDKVPEPAKTPETPAVGADKHSPAQMVHHVKELLNTLEMHSRDAAAYSILLKQPNSTKDQFDALVANQNNTVERIREDLKELRNEITSITRSTNWTEVEAYKFIRALSPKGGADAGGINYENLPLPRSITTWDEKRGFIETPVGDFAPMRDGYNQAKRFESQIKGNTTDPELKGMLDAIMETRSRLGNPDLIPLPRQQFAFSTNPGAVNAQNINDVKAYVQSVQTTFLEVVNKSMVPDAPGAPGMPGRAIVDDAWKVEDARRTLSNFRRELTMAPPPIQMTLTDEQKQQIHDLDAASPRRDRSTDPNPVRTAAMYIIKLRDEMNGNLKEMSDIVLDPYQGQRLSKLREYSNSFLDIDPNTGKPTKFAGEPVEAAKIRELAAEGINKFFAEQPGTTPPGQNLNDLKNSLEKFAAAKAPTLSPTEIAAFSDFRRAFGEYVDNQIAANPPKGSDEFRDLRLSNEFLAKEPAKKALKFILDNGDKWSQAQKREFRDRMEHSGYTRDELVGLTFEETFKQLNITDTNKQRDFIRRAGNMTLPEEQKKRLAPNNFLTADEQAAVTTARDIVGKEKNVGPKWLEVRAADRAAVVAFEREVAPLVEALKAAF